MDSIVISNAEVISIGDLFEKGDFKKRDLVLKTEGEYPQFLQVEFVKEKEEMLNFRSVGEKVEVKANLRGREWTDKNGDKKYFLSLQAWSIKLM